MAYNVQEISVQQGTPFFLYEFNTSATTYRFTDHPVAINANSETWEPFPIKHTEIKQSNEISKNGITVTIPLSGTFADLFLGWSPDEVITLTLRRGHFGSVDTLVYWKGRLVSHNLKKQTIELKCESIFTSLRRAGIRARYQRNCRHVLYGPGCNLDKADFANPGFVTSFSGSTYTVDIASSQTDGWFNGGIMEFHDGSFRMIKSHIGNTIIVTRPSRDPLDNFTNTGYGINYGSYYGGYNVILYPGCDRTVATCKSKFDNLLNQGGFKWIPFKNPMGGSSIL